MNDLPAGERLALTARQLLLEDQACRAFELLAASGIACVVIKGPVTARLLYEDPLQHPYGDIDLLVGPAEFERAKSLFLDIGFVDLADGVEQVYRADNEAHLLRGEVCIDLHSRLVGVPPTCAQHAWDVLTASLETLTIHGTELPVLPPPARALHLPLHVAQSPDSEKPLRDLSRGLEAFDALVWESACDLAIQVDALPAFAFGLRRVPEGVALADRLALPRWASADTWLRLRGAPQEALALERLRSLAGVAARWRYVASLLSVVDASAAGPGRWRRRAVVAARLLLAVPVWLRAVRQERYRA